MPRKNDRFLEINRVIGGKIYSLRLGMGLSREQLSKVIGVTQQQLLKYEKGTDSITVGRLVLIAKALSKDPVYFYEGLETDIHQPVITQHQRLCIELSRNFMKITSSEYQNTINILVKSLLSLSGKRLS